MAVVAVALVAEAAAAASVRRHRVCSPSPRLKSTRGQDSIFKSSKHVSLLQDFNG